MTSDRWIAVFSLLFGIIQTVVAVMQVRRIGTRPDDTSPPTHRPQVGGPVQPGVVPGLHRYSPIERICRFGIGFALAGGGVHLLLDGATSAGGIIGTLVLAITALAPMAPTLWAARELSHLAVPAVGLVIGALASLAIESSFFYIGCLACVLAAAAWSRGRRYWVAWLNSLAVMTGYWIAVPWLNDSGLANLYLRIILIIILLVMIGIFAVVWAASSGNDSAMFRLIDRLKRALI